MTSLFRTIAKSRFFNTFILIVILLAGITVGLETYEEIRIHYASILAWIDFFVISVFIAEIVIKIGAHGKRPQDYFKDPWNVFDFIIVSVCLLPLDHQFIMVLRLVRILRMLRLISVLPKLQILAIALLKSIPSMIYVSILLLLLFYVYATVATFVFRENDPLHFESLQISMLSLFRVVTLEDWTDIMYIQMYGSDAYSYPSSEQLVQFTSLPARPQAFPIFAPLFFISFVLLGTMIMLNLFIGIIMTGMEEARSEAMEKMSGNNVSDPSPPFAQKLTDIEKQLADIQANIRAIKDKL